MKRNKIKLFTIFILFILININIVTSSEIIKKDEKIMKLTYNQGADLYLEGNLKWTNAQPGENVQGSFIVRNIGAPNSELSWSISVSPDWGSWIFNPRYGDGLKPEDTPVTVQVTLTVPDEYEQSYSGAIRVANLQNRSGDTETLWTTLSTPREKNINKEITNNFVKISLFFKLLLITRVIDAFIDR